MKDLKFTEFCAYCRGKLADVPRLYFVEKEIGRCFCSEECIHGYFAPATEQMREEYIRERLVNDFSSEDFEPLEAKCKSETLHSPDEVWVQHAETGDMYYTFIRHYEDDDIGSFHYICVALGLDGEPSYVFLGFPTRDEGLVDFYRRGDDLRVDLVDQMPPQIDDDEDDEEPEEGLERPPSLHREAQLEMSGDGGASEFERICREYRKSDDIALSEFQKFEAFVEPSLEDPDEIWTRTLDDGRQWCTFISRFSGDEEVGFTMIVICMPVGKTRTLEVTYAFPTNDVGLVQQFRQGMNVLNKAFNIGINKAA